MASTSSAPDRPLTRLAGVVEVADLRQGTASAHRGATLRTAGGEAVPLVRIGGNPFDDPETRALAGQPVEVEGYRVGSELRFVRITPKG